MNNYILTVFINPMSTKLDAENVSDALSIHVEDPFIKGLSFRGTPARSVIMLSFPSKSAPAAVRKTLTDAGLFFCLSKGKDVSLPPDVVEYFEVEKPLADQLQDAIGREDYEEAARIQRRIDTEKK